MYIVIHLQGKKNEKLVYQKNQVSNDGKDYQKSCWANGEASDYGYQTILAIFQRPTS